MIQRIQSVYLFFVMLISGILPFWVNFWSEADGSSIFAEDDIFISIAFYATALLALIAIVVYKRRKNQFILNRLNIVLNLFLLGFFIYRILNISEVAPVSEKGMGLFIPIISIVLLVLANRAIKKDEDLIKSVDRLR